MRVVTLEEHFSLVMPGVYAPAVGAAPGKVPSVMSSAGDKMTDLGAGRLSDMDRNGITVQVLSKAGVHGSPSADAGISSST